MKTRPTETILQEMRAKAATLCRKGHLGAAEEWRELANRLESAILADRAGRGNSEAEIRKARYAPENVEALVAVARRLDGLYQPESINHMADDQPDSQGIFGVNGHVITLGDLRRLRGALAALNEKESRNG